LITPIREAIQSDVLLFRLSSGVPMTIHLIPHSSRFQAAER
jgi:hypothetical protein